MSVEDIIIWELISPFFEVRVSTSVLFIEVAACFGIVCPQAITIQFQS